MMKKITGLLFCVAMLFSLTACGGSKVDDDALDALEAAIANVADMKSADYAMDIKVKADDADQKMALHGSYNAETSNVQLSAVLDMEADGMKQDNYMAIYITDGMMYMNMMDIAKQKQSFDSLMEGQAMPSINLDKDTIKIPKDQLKEYLSEASIDGDKLTLVFDNDKIKEEVKKQQKDKDSTQGELLNDVEINELKMVVKLKNKMMSSAEINMEMSKKVDDKTETATMNMSLTFKNINKVKTVTFPDFSDYLEANENPLIQ